MYPAITMTQPMPNAFKTIAKSIASFPEPDPDENPWVHGKPIQEIIEVVAYDPQWNIIGKQTAGTIKEALGDVALNIAHVGSTAVPGLSAKPVIDIAGYVKLLYDVLSLSDKFRCMMQTIQTSYRSSAAAMQRLRNQRRENGMRPVQIWVPDTRQPEFVAECHRQARNVASNTIHERKVMNWIESVVDCKGWEA